MHKKLMGALVGLALFGMAIFTGFSGVAHATIISSTTASDRTVFDSNNDNVIDSALSATDGFIRVFGFGSVDRGVWEYDFSGVTSGATINSVSVLFEDRGSTTPGQVNLFGFSGDGTATAADGNLTSTLIASFVFVAGNLDYVVGLNVAFFQSLVDTNALFAGIVMVSSDEINFGPGADICSFDSIFSLCAGTTGSTLTIDFDATSVPEPSTLALFVIALAGLGFMTRRRRVA